MTETNGATHEERQAAILKKVEKGERLNVEEVAMLNRIVRHADDEPEPTHEIPSEDFKQALAELKTVVREAAEQRISTEESEKRTEKLVARVEKAREKNTPVHAPHTQLFQPIAGMPLSWERAMRMKTSDKTILGFQELQTDVMRRAMILAVRDRALPNAELGVEMLGEVIPRRYFEAVPEFKELQHVRNLAAGSFIDTTTATSGAEWVPTGFARTGVDFPFVDSDFIPQLEQVNIPDGVGDFRVPLETARAQAVRVPQTTAVQSTFIRTTGISTPLTDTWKFSPQVIELGYQWSMEADMDLAVDMLSRATRQTQVGCARGIRQVAINAQEASDATLDDAPAVSGLRTADGFSAAFGGRGYRLHCIENAYTDSLGGARCTYLDTLTAREKMGKFGAKPEELIILTGPKGGIGMLADKDVRTADVFLNNATILRGSLASVGAASLYVDSEFPDNMTAAGIDAGTGTLSGVIVLNRTRWALANKRTVETVIIPGLGTYLMTVISRARFDHAVAVPGSVGGGAGSGEHSAHYLINVK